jgi:hypothetical protein
MVTRKSSKLPLLQGRKRKPRDNRNNVDVDLASILAIDHACTGCTPKELCCCARYEVCVNNAELNRIIEVLPEIVKLCPHLETDEGFENMFDEVERGLYALDTTEEGLCLLAFASNNTIQCSLHTVASRLGLPLWHVKPKACLLWPLSFSEGKEVLSLDEDALSFPCTTRKEKPSRRLCSAFVETIEIVYGKGYGTQVQKDARKGARRTTLIGTS